MDRIHIMQASHITANEILVIRSPQINQEIVCQ